MSVHHPESAGGASWDIKSVVAPSASALPYAHKPYTSTSIFGKNISINSMQPEPQSSPGLGERQLYTKEQWEARKPTIFRLYNQEKKPFNRVIEILRHEHDFFPTRRQFYRKISDWGFEKNIKNSEMRAMADSLKNNITGDTVDLKGRQVEISKIKQWQKKQVRMIRSVQPSPNNTPNIPKENFLSTLDMKEPTIPATGESSIITEDSGLVPLVENTESSQSFSIWHTVDVPGSPLLTRFFGALQIECPNGIPHILIGSPIAVAAQSYIADIGIEDIDLGDQIDDTRNNEGTAVPSLSNHSSLVPWNKDPPSSHLEPIHPTESFDEWASAHWGFSRGLPSNIEFNMSPLRPLSSFPILSNTSVPRTKGLVSNQAYGWQVSLEAKEATYKSRLKRLKRMFGPDDPRTLDVMDCLANFYWENCKYRPAEALWRHIAKSSQRVHGFQHRDTLSAYTNVINILVWQGKYQHAASIHRQVHATISSLTGPEDSLNIYSIEVLLGIYTGLARIREADELSRQMLQMTLRNFGPRHTATLYAMGHLARVLGSSRSLLESEQLFSTIAQLYLEAQGIEDSLSLENKLDLAITFRLQGRYRECINLALETAEQWEALLGPENECTFRCHYHAAVSLLNLGYCTEGERLLRITLQGQLKLHENSNAFFTDTMFQLALMLRETGRCEESVSYFERSFEAIVENFGWEYPDTIIYCDNLGRCYEKLGRYNDAFALYQRTMDQTRATVAHDHLAITKISGWIIELREIVARISEDACQTQSEVEVDDKFSNERNSAGENEAGEESKLTETGVATPSEEWMNDFVDFQTPKEDKGEVPRPDGLM